MRPRKPLTMSEATQAALAVLHEPDGANRISSAVEDIAARNRLDAGLLMKCVYNAAECPPATPDEKRRDRTRMVHKRRAGEGIELQTSDGPVTVMIAGPLNRHSVKLVVEAPPEVTVTRVVPKHEEM